MARIAGVDLPREKKVEIGLTYIFGIGRATARRILESTGVNSEQRIRDLNRELSRQEARLGPARSSLWRGRTSAILSSGGMMTFPPTSWRLSSTMRPCR